MIAVMSDSAGWAIVGFIIGTQVVTLLWTLSDRYDGGRRG